MPAVEVDPHCAEKGIGINLNSRRRAIERALLHIRDTHSTPDSFVMVRICLTCFEESYSSL